MAMQTLGAQAPGLRNYEQWAATCDTLHAHTRVLGKLAAALAPPEPELQHTALRLTPRRLETAPLPAPDGSGALVVTLDLHSHEAVAEHSDGRAARIPLTHDRSVARVTRDLLGSVTELAGGVEIDPTPQEVTWDVPLDADEAHHRYDVAHVASHFAAATRAALVLAAFRAPYRGRSTPVNAWWGSFDLAVSLYSGEPADPPADDFITRNAMDAQEVAVGWWPGDERYGRPAYYAYAHPKPSGFEDVTPPVGAKWQPDLGDFVLDDTGSPADALAFVRWAFQHSCVACDWDPALPASAEGDPPPIT
jgi:hypothetical protein